jgi:hypothetical protein
MVAAVSGVLLMTRVLRSGGSWALALAPDETSNIRGELAAEPEDVVHPVLLGGWWCQSPSTKEKPDEAAR